MQTYVLVGEDRAERNPETGHDGVPVKLVVDGQRLDGLAGSVDVDDAVLGVDDPQQARGYVW